MSQNFFTAWTDAFRIRRLRKARTGLVMVLLSMVMWGSSVQAEEATESSAGTEAAQKTVSQKNTRKRGLVKEGNYYRYYKKDGKALRRRWKMINGRKYYFQANGNAAIGSVQINGRYYIFNARGCLLAPRNNAIMKVKNRYYFVSPGGTPVPGWNLYKGKLYYVYVTGRCAANRTINGIRLTKNASAQDDVHTKLKIKSMQVISAITTPSMTQNAKLRKCWYYLNTIRFQPSNFPDTTKKDWPQQCALDLLNTMGGNCYGFANAFAALAKELGYEPYVIEIPRCHCWVRINGLYWDNMGNRMGVAASPRAFSSNQIYRF